MVWGGSASRSPRAGSARPVQLGHQRPHSSVVGAGGAGIQNGLDLVVRPGRAIRAEPYRPRENSLLPPAVNGVSADPPGPLANCGQAGISARCGGARHFVALGVPRFAAGQTIAQVPTVNAT